MLFSLSKEEYEAKYPVYRRSSFIVKRDITYLKEWMSKQPHLPQNHEDEWLKAFLAGCKYNLEICKKKLDVYFTVKTSVPEWFSLKDPTSEDIKNTVSELALFLLPTPHPNGSFIMFGKLLECENENFNVRSNIQRFTIYADCCLRHIYKHDLIVVMDCEGGTLNHALQAIQERITDVAYYFMNAYPFDVREFHTINTPLFADFIKSMILPTLPQEVRDRVHFHSDKLDSLYEFIPKELLPLEIGGNAGTIKELNDTFYKRVVSCRDWLMDHGAKGVDESKRSEKSKQEQKLLVPEESFRSLNID